MSTAQSADPASLPGFAFAQFTRKTFSVPVRKRDDKKLERLRTSRTAQPRRLSNGNVSVLLKLRFVPEPEAG